MTTALVPSEVMPPASVAVPKLNSQEMAWCLLVVKDRKEPHAAVLEVWPAKRDAHRARTFSKGKVKKLLGKREVLDYIQILKTEIDPTAQVLTVQRRREILNKIAERFEEKGMEGWAIKAIIEDAKLAGEHAPELEKKEMTITVQRKF